MGKGNGTHKKKTNHKKKESFEEVKRMSSIVTYEQ